MLFLLCISHAPLPRLVKVNWTFKKSTLLHRLVLSIELGIVQTGKVDPARKFKCTTTAARAQNDTRIFLYHFWILWFNRFKIFFEWLYFLILIIKLVIYYLISNFKFWLTSFSWFYYNISFRLFLCSVAPPLLGPSPLKISPSLFASLYY